MIKKEPVLNGLICVLIFVLIHDIVASAVMFLLENQSVIASSIGNLAGLPFLLYWIQTYCKKEFQKTFFFRYWIPIVAISASILCNGVLTLSGFTKMFANDYEQTTNQLYGTTLIVTIIFSVIIAPITEELLYRRILYKQIKEEYGFYIASFISSVLFGIAHMAIVQGIYGFLTGLLLCYCYEVGKQIKIPILVHMIMNLTSIIGTQILYAMSQNIQIIFWLIGSIVSLCILTIFILKSRSKLEVLL